jgi:adenylosuccinate synthase
MKYGNIAPIKIEYSLNPLDMKVDVLLGLQWGDEGKGKIVDVLTPDYDIIARFQGGPNAGHTLCIGDVTHVLHQIPSGILREGIINVMGAGMVIDLVKLAKEIRDLLEKFPNIDFKGRLLISKRAHIILPTHRWLDSHQESLKDYKIGTTGRGIGPCYQDRKSRIGLTVGQFFGEKSFEKEYKLIKKTHMENLSNSSVKFILYEEEDLLDEAVGEIRGLIKEGFLEVVDASDYLNNALSEGKKTLAEGAQGTLLDNTFGSFPYVTSSDVTTGGVCTGLGIAPYRIGKVIGITKAYCTRVGEGPFPTELFDEVGKDIGNKGGEFGSTTGRPRRCGWIDLPLLRYTIRLNGVGYLILTKEDVLSAIDGKSVINVCDRYEHNEKFLEFPPMDNLSEVKPVYERFAPWKNIKDLNFKLFVEFIEGRLGIKIVMVSTGPGRDDIDVRIPFSDE